MGLVRSSAIATLGLLVVYYILRAVGGGCTTSQCDVTVLPWSALLPLLIVVLVAVTGALAIVAARRGTRTAQNPAVNGRHATWFVVLGACTVVGILGPLVLLAVLGNNPNLFVFLATVLVALTPLGALIYSFAADGPGRQG
jgi:hypothetical protein